MLRDALQKLLVWVFVLFIVGDLVWIFLVRVVAIAILFLIMELDLDLVLPQGRIRIRPVELFVWVFVLFTAVDLVWIFLMRVVAIVMLFLMMELDLDLVLPHGRISSRPEELLVWVFVLFTVLDLVWIFLMRVVAIVILFLIMGLDLDSVLPHGRIGIRPEELLVWVFVLFTVVDLDWIFLMRVVAIVILFLTMELDLDSVLPRGRIMGN